MKRNQLNDMSVFVEVARANGFRAAAEHLKLGAGSVSEAVQRFEDRLGVRLIDRTTRKIALTAAGEKLYQRSLPAINDLERAMNELNENQDVVAGTLRLSAPRSAGPFFLDALIGEFGLLYPEVNVEVIYDDQKVDLVSSGVDAAIRSQTLLEQDTHAMNIGPRLDLTIVASPTYLEKNGEPQKPADVLKHDGICFAFGNANRLAPWNFTGKEGVYTVMPKARMIVNDMTSMLNYAASGLGIAYLYAKTAEPYVQSGSLVNVLSNHIQPLPNYTINYLSKRNMPTRLRAFIELAKRNREQ